MCNVPAAFAVFADAAWVANLHQVAHALKEMYLLLQQRKEQDSKAVGRDEQDSSAEQQQQQEGHKPRRRKMVAQRKAQVGQQEQQHVGARSGPAERMRLRIIKKFLSELEPVQHGSRSRSRQ